jgi:hypothetical protein
MQPIDELVKLGLFDPLFNDIMNLNFNWNPSKNAVVAESHSILLETILLEILGATDHFQRLPYATNFKDDIRKLCAISGAEDLRRRVFLWDRQRVGDHNLMNLRPRSCFRGNPLNPLEGGVGPGGSHILEVERRGDASCHSGGFNDR